MMSLDLFVVFARVAESGSFSKAARDLGLSKATVSKRVAELEAALGVGLVARTTRRAALTEAGERTLARAQRIIEEADAARDEAVEARSSPKGRLRISAPITFGVRYLAALLPDFLSAYPDIDLDLSFADKTVDLIGDGYDAAVRIRALEDSSLVARKLAPVQGHVVAAPAYWDRHGRPQRPEDLTRHVCFSYANVSSLWRFENAAGERVSVRVENSRLTYDNADAIEPAVCAGVGLARQPDFIAWRDIASGKIEAVLEDWQAGPEMWLHLLTPPGRSAPRKMRVFSDFLHDHFGAGRAPWVRG